MKKFFLLSMGLIAACLSFSQQKKHTQLSGTVTDVRTGQPLHGASVVLADSKTGTATDTAGHYSLENIPVGHTIIEVSFTGYKTLVEHLDLSSNTEHNFTLQPSILVSEGVTVTAVANATSIRKAPISITRVNRSELLQNVSSNIVDALSRQPGVSQLSTGPAISKPVIRGLGYNRLVVINDGVRQEGQQWGDEHGIEIDENSVNRVEIVKGPAALMYGSDAIGGVINIVTSTPVPVNTIRGNVLGSYQTNNRQRSVFGNFAGNRNGFNWNAWGDYKAAADYTNKYDGHVFNSKFNEHNFGGYAGLNKSWGYTHLIVSNFNQTLGVIEGERNDEGLFIKQLPGGMEAAATAGDFSGTKPSVPYQQVRHFKIIADNSFRVDGGRISLNLAWQRNQRQEFGNPDAPDVNDLYFDLRTFNYSAMYHLAEHKGWTTSLGINGMQQNNFNKAEEVLIPEYNLLDAGAFVYTQKTIAKTTVSGGLRYDHRHLKSKEMKEGSNLRFEGFQRSFSNISASAGLSYGASENLLFKANLATGFRAPSIPELASNGAHEGTNRYEYGNKQLSSEKSYQADLGFEINTDHLLLTASAFYNRINDFIFYTKLPAADGTDSLVNVNGGMVPAFRFGQQDAQLAGVELLADLHPHPLDWLHWQNTFSYVRGKFSREIEGVNDMPLMPPPRWISQFKASFLPAGKHIRNLSWSFEVDHSFAQNHPFTAFETETATAAYTLLNAGLHADVVSRDKILFSIYLNGANLTDEAYQNHLSRLKYSDVNLATGRAGVFNMGRNFSIKLNVPFNFRAG